MKKSKFLAVLLALTMLLTLIPAAALAEEPAGNEPETEQTVPAEETEAPDGGEEVPGGSGAEEEPVELTEVQKLQARIDALPGGDELDGMDEDALQAVSDGARELMDALEELSQEEFAALDLSKLDALMAWFEVVPETVEGANVAKIGGTEYATLAEAITAAGKAQAPVTIELLADLSDTGAISLPANATLNGKKADNSGNYTISGNSNVYINANGGTLTNVNFKNIHNSTDKLSAVYGTGLSGTARISGCTFDTCDWDTIQITPVADAVIEITENSFKHSGTQGICTGTTYLRNAG